MKHFTRIFPVAAALLMLSGCTSADILLSENSTVPEPEPPIPYYNLDKLEQQIKTLEKQWSETGNDDSISQQIDGILHAADEAYSIYMRTEIQYYANWKNQNLINFHDRTYEDYNIACEMIAWAFANGYKKSVYSDLFEPYTDTDNLNYYLYHNLNRIKNYAKTDADESADLLNHYYDIAYDQDIDIDETNLQCAELYLDTLKSRDTEQFLYDTYHRDYTVEQASQLYAEMKETILPVYNQLHMYLVEGKSLSASYSSHIDAYELLKTYAPEISPSVAESVDKLFSESLYQRAEGADCYDGSYTVALTDEHTAMMYTYLDGSWYDLPTVVHEFGHFHADWRDSTPVLMQQPCQDIAEVQSQGMEILFTGFYDDIFGENADTLEMVTLYNIMDSVVSGLAIGEFEYRVMQLLDTITPEETVALFHEITEECGFTMDLYPISHLYEQPGYYVSYGISALAAIQLYALMQEDYDQAVSVYEKICSISGLSGEYQFCAAMNECGFSDYFAEDALQQISGTLSNRIAELSGQYEETEDAA